MLKHILNTCKNYTNKKYNGEKNTKINKFDFINEQQYAYGSFEHYIIVYKIPKFIEKYIAYPDAEEYINIQKLKYATYYTHKIIILFMIDKFNADNKIDCKNEILQPPNPIQIFFCIERAFYENIDKCNNKYTGIYMKYYDNGTLYISGVYNKNTKVGRWIYFAESGNVILYVLYPKYGSDDDPIFVHKKIKQNDLLIS